jgi:hypothetical protein
MTDDRVCPKVAGLRCSVQPCPGRQDPAVCDHLASLTDWRRMTPLEQVGLMRVARPAIDPIVRDAVNACPSRGPILPLSLQDDCGCQGKELSECRAGRGTIPGRVTLRDCLKCQGAVIP